MKSDVSMTNRAIKRQRVMRYFIDAARSIISLEGIEALNIRSVAARAGYNSASLYNYFDNLDELIAFTVIDMMVDWLKDLAVIESQQDEDPLIRYIKGWESFCGYAFAEPLAYQYVYGHSNKTPVAVYFDAYVEAFPETFENIPDLLIEMFQAKTVAEQEEIMICPSVQAGYFDHETAEKIWTLAHILINGIFPMVISEGEQSDPDKYISVFMTYFIPFIQGRLEKTIDLSQFLKNDNT